MEGPFGDHYGHYSEAELFPVFHVNTVTRRRNAICPAAVVGKPPQEDKWVGNAAGEIIGPLIKVVNPNITDLFGWDDAVFHNLLAVSLAERHPKEVLKVALNLLGTGQLVAHQGGADGARGGAGAELAGAAHASCGTGSSPRSG